MLCNRRVKQGEEWVDETTFVDVTLWGRQAELASQYLGKGVVFIEGRLQMDSWVDQQSGQKRQRLKVVGENMQFVGGGGAGGGGGQRPPQQGAPQQANQAPAQQSVSSSAAATGRVTIESDASFEDEDDDIPFKIRGQRSLIYLFFEGRALMRCSAFFSAVPAGFVFGSHTQLLCHLFIPFPQWYSYFLKTRIQSTSRCAG
ncbi:single-stranded DNA-binding protein [Rubritalea tangerina]|uniref:single-stranded DNA-binding protein n=1 Tax=Rubritalea tangerina TaxID=430798 RepID=UPI003606DA9E